MTNRMLSFRIGTTIRAGYGCLRELPAQLNESGARRISVVADRGVAQAGLLDQVLDGVEAAELILVDPNPDVDTVEEATATARKSGCDSVLGVGGGSALGAAKAVAIRLTNDEPITAFEGVGRVTRPPARSIAVPTTAGSGSEVSNALVLHESGRDREIVVRGAGCEPDVAFLDGQVLRGLPREPMLFAALDALSHALEALWSGPGGIFTDSLATAAADTIIEILPEALDTRDEKPLQRLMEASCAANLACGNTGLGLVHALSSSPYVPLPHGYQNGALLLHVARFNAEYLEPRLRYLIDRTADLFDRLGFPGRFRSGEISEDQREHMVTASTDHPFRLNNRRPSTDDDLRAVLHAAGAR